MITIENTGFKGLLIIKPIVIQDNRGYFFESFNLDQFYSKTGIRAGFVQDNEAKSDKGVLRGLHYQLPPFAQSKLVRVVKGSVIDIVVDIRPDSNTFGEYLSIELTEQNKWQLFIPKGFAHGYHVLKNNTIFAYKCDAFYNPSLEYGIRYDDTDLKINWHLDTNEPIVSQKDLQLPDFKDHQKFI